MKKKYCTACQVPRAQAKPVKLEELAELYGRLRWSLASLARHFEVSTESVKSHLVAAGVKLRTRRKAEKTALLSLSIKKGVYFKKTSYRGKRIRDRRWERLRRKFIKEEEGACNLCRASASNVHHIKHVSTHPELQLERDNLLLLCTPCHRLQHAELPESLFIVHKKESTSFTTSQT